MPTISRLSAMLFGIVALMGTGCVASDPVTYPAAGATQNPVGGTWRVAAAPKPGPELRVMSFNIRRPVLTDGLNHWPNRRQKVARFIHQQQPDIIGLQECVASQRDDLLQQLPMYASVGVGRADGRLQGEMCAIFYRPSRFDLLKQGHFWLSETPREPGSKSWGAAWTRMVSWVRLHDRNTGQDLYLFNTHFSVASDRAREASARMLVAAIDKIAGDAPVIVTGDFNDAPDSLPHQLLTQGTRHAKHSGTSFTLNDTYRMVHRRQSYEPGTRHGFSGDTRGNRMDWVMTSPAFDVLEAGLLNQPVDGRYVSDHHPVFAVMRLHNAPALAQAQAVASVNQAN